MRPIRWPAGTGVVAYYQPHEERFIRSVVDGGDLPGADRDAVAAEVAFLHDLKAAFDGTFLP